MRKRILTLFSIIIILLIGTVSYGASIIDTYLMTSHSYYKDNNRTSYIYAWSVVTDEAVTVDEVWYKCPDIGVNDYTKMRWYLESYSNKNNNLYADYRGVSPDVDYGGFTFYFAIGNDPNNPIDTATYIAPTRTFTFIPFVKRFSFENNIVRWSRNNTTTVDLYKVRVYGDDGLTLLFSQDFPADMDDYMFEFTNELDGIDPSHIGNLSVEAYELDEYGHILNRSRLLTKFNPVPIPGSAILLLSGIGYLVICRKSKSNKEEK